MIIAKNIKQDSASLTCDLRFSMVAFITKDYTRVFLFHDNEYFDMKEFTLSE